MRYYSDDEDELRMSFGSALVHDSAAMDYFAGLNAKRQDEIVNASRYIGSKHEMRKYVSNLSDYR